MSFITRCDAKETTLVSIIFYYFIEVVLRMILTLNSQRGETCQRLSRFLFVQRALDSTTGTAAVSEVMRFMPYF